jgi:hypothetical protein
VLKTAILSMEKGREMIAEAGEAFEDIVAEVKAELASDSLGVVEQVVETTAEAVKPE